MKLSREELIRYSRQLSLKDFGVETQLHLKNAKILVVGAGGLGCPALLYLASAGIGTIGVVDFDTVALHNLQRQVLFTEDDIGKPKAEVVVRHLQKRNSTITYHVYNEQLTQERALGIFPGYDIIVDCTDRIDARYAINDACVSLNKPFVYGSVFRYEGQVALFNAWNNATTQGPTYRCLFPEPANESETNCETAGVIGFLPGLIGTLQACEAIKWVAGIGESLSGKLLTVNSLNLLFDLFEVERNENLWRKKIPSLQFTEQ